MIHGPRRSNLGVLLRQYIHGNNGVDFYSLISKSLQFTGILSVGRETMWSVSIYSVTVSDVDTKDKKESTELTKPF